MTKILKRNILTIAAFIVAGRILSKNAFIWHGAYNYSRIERFWFRATGNRYGAPLYTIVLIFINLFAAGILNLYLKMCKDCTKLELVIVIIVINIIIGLINYYFLIVIRNSGIGFLASMLPSLSLFTYLIGKDE